MTKEFEAKFEKIDEDTRINMEDVLGERDHLSKILQLNLPKLNKKWTLKINLENTLQFLNIN